MQETLNKLHNWCRENLMTVNIEKTNYQLFSLGWKERELTLYYNGHQIDKSNKTKYLGVTFDNKLSWKKHRANLQQITLKS